jgi:hypothetical protein
MADLDVRPEAVLDEAFGRLPVNPRGEAMLRELIMIHNLLRQNVEIVGALAEATAAGLPSVEVLGQVVALGDEHGLRMLQTNCFAYCRFVHGHHGLEDAAVFPRVRAANPAIGPVVDRLVADHRRVADLLNVAEAAAGALSATEEAREGVVLALKALGDHLLEHLAYEERSLGPTLQRMTGWY